MTVLWETPENDEIRGMELNDTTAAPSVTDTAAAFEIWSAGHTGSFDDFIAFLTAPSAAREKFVAGLPGDVSFYGSVLTVSI